MKLSKVMSTLLVIMALVTSLPREQLNVAAEEDQEKYSNEEASTTTFSYLQGASDHRFLADKPPRGQMTCDRYPSICRGKGSGGPNCCNKQCVNVLTDRANCGKCGKQCGYSKMCCQGKCVDLSLDEKHCGRCNNSCKKGSSCAYGLCSYA